MICIVFFIFVAGIMEILGRPNIGNNEIENNLQWPLGDNLFLLPRTINVDDTINVTVFAKYAIDEVNLSFTANSTDKVIFSLNANKGTGVTITDANGKKIISGLEIEHFIQEDNEPRFNVRFKFRKDSKTHKMNVLEVNGKTDSNEGIVRHLNRIRYMKFSGDNARAGSWDWSSPGTYTQLKWRGMYVRIYLKHISMVRVKPMPKI